MRLLIIFTGVLVLAALYLLLRHHAPGALTPPTPATSAPLQPPPASAELQQSEAPIERRFAGIVLTVLGANDEPLSTARAGWHDGPSVPTIRSEPPLTADGDGRIRLDGARPGQQVLVRAPGHVPSLFEVLAPPAAGQATRESNAQPNAQVVRLQPSAALDVVVTRSRNEPVSAATLTLSPHSSTEFLALTNAPEPGLGNPTSDRPLWVVVTDATGRAAFDELPPGRYFLNVIAPPLIPTGNEGANGSFELGASRLTVHLDMEELSAALFAVPSESRVAKLHWNVPKIDLELSPRVLRRIGPARSLLEARFPGAMAYVHHARGDKRPRIACYVQLEDGSAWSGEWPLTPISECTAPVFLERDLRPRREVTVRLEDAAGREMPGYPVAFAPKDTPLEKGQQIASGVTGEPISVAHGTYTLTPGQGDAIVVQTFFATTVVVDASSDVEHVVRLPEPVAKVHVNVIYPDAEVLGPIVIHLRNERGEGPAIANWRPSRGPILRLIPGKQVTIQVQGGSYEDELFDSIPVPDSGELHVDVRLRRKPVQVR
jgi:hypothetical protein